MEAGNTAEEIVRRRFEREGDFDYYQLSTTSSIKKPWPNTTPGSPPRRSPNTSSPSAATRRKKTEKESN